VIQGSPADFYPSATQGMSQEETPRFTESHFLPVAILSTTCSVGGSCGLCSPTLRELHHSFRHTGLLEGFVVLFVVFPPSESFLVWDFLLSLRIHSPVAVVQAFGHRVQRERVGPKLRGQWPNPEMCTFPVVGANPRRLDPQSPNLGVFQGNSFPCVGLLAGRAWSRRHF